MNFRPPWSFANHCSDRKDRSTFDPLMVWPGQMEPICSWSIPLRYDTVLLFVHATFSMHHCDASRTELRIMIKAKNWLSWLILSCFSFERGKCVNPFWNHISIVHPQSPEVAVSFWWTLGTPSISNRQRQLRLHPSPPNHQLSQHETPHVQTISWKLKGIQGISKKPCGSRIFGEPKRWVFLRFQKDRLRVFRFDNFVWLFLSCGFCEKWWIWWWLAMIHDSQWRSIKEWIQLKSHGGS